MSTSVPSHTAEARFRSLIHHLGAIVWEGTPGPRSGEAALTFVSDGTQTLLGYAPERWTADPRFWIEVIHPDDRRRVAEQLSQAIDAREGADLVYRSLTADGREVWLRNIVRIPGGRRGAAPPRRRGRRHGAAPRRRAARAAAGADGRAVGDAVGP